MGVRLSVGLAASRHRAYAGQKAGAPTPACRHHRQRTTHANIIRVKPGDTISRFRIQQPLHCLRGELPLPLYRAQDLAARSWVLVQPFPEDAPPAEVEAAALHSEALADITRLVSNSLEAPAHLAWALGGGETLRQRLQRAPLGPEQAAELGLAIARALRELHRAGVVHGGLRPANVQRLEDGEVKLLAPSSLGPVTLAVASEAIESPSLWTAAYLSPEQIEGAAAAVTGDPVPFTTADDVWTLGVVLYELVTGELPFIANTYAAMRRAVAVQPIDLAGALPGSAPEAFEPVFAAALDRDADRRRAALDDVIARLRRIRDELRPRVRSPEDSVSRVHARKSAVAGDHSAASPAKGEWQSAIETMNDRRRRLARERPPPPMWRVLLLPLAALLLAGAVAVLLLL
ncbi:MAG: protein kinase [Holophagales bacterium]|nr:protein kinase [Holophagales bacterium]MYC11146.1 protein kinase [Holophagales bacterium]